MTDTNGGQANAAPALNSPVQYSKDLSFENPNAPRSLGPQESGPNINIQVNVNAKQLAEADFEVELLLEGSAGEGANLLFKFELTYSGVFRLINIPAERSHPVVMIECPRLLFPFPDRWSPIVCATAAFRRFISTRSTSPRSMRSACSRRRRRSRPSCPEPRAITALKRGRPIGEGSPFLSRLIRPDSSVR